MYDLVRILPDECTKNNGPQILYETLEKEM